jgi:SH3-like domain-containing protein
MRGSSFAIFIVVSGLVVGAASFATAETVVSTDPATVYLKPGEGSRVVVKIKSGQEMTVLRRDGRWLKVRVRGRTGFIPRTKVLGDGDGGADVERQTRRRPYVDGRSTERGWGGEPPEDRRGVDAVENIDPSEPAPAPREAIRDRDREPAVERKAAPVPKRAEEPDPELAVERKAAPVPKRREVPEPAAAEEDAPEQASKPERPRVRLEQDVQLRAKPATKSKKVASVGPGEYFLVEERSGWAHIESEDGEKGWVSSKLIIGDTAEVAPRRMIALGAQVGFTSVGQGTRTTGGAKGIPDNYNLSTSGASATIGGSIAFPVKQRFLAGGELVYVGTKALPGIVYQGSTIGIMLHNVDARVLGGYNLRNRAGMVIWGRLGFHYDMFSVADVSNLEKNKAKIPSENLSGATAGLSFTAPRLFKEFGLNVGFDALLTSSRSQTKNLEDGVTPSATGAWVFASGSYRLAARTSIDLGYRLAYLSNSFGAPPTTSMRGHTGGAVARVDVSHGVSLGISQAF